MLTFTKKTMEKNTSYHDRKPIDQDRKQGVYHLVKRSNCISILAQTLIDR
jgi:hypothetical protein